MLKYISDCVAVISPGKIVELADRKLLYNNPLHPYTQALLSAMTAPDPIKERNRKRFILMGDIPSPANPPKGCRFHTRCPLTIDICKETETQWREVSPDHWASLSLGLIIYTRRVKHENSQSG